MFCFTLSFITNFFLWLFLIFLIYFIFISILTLTFKRKNFFRLKQTIRDAKEYLLDILIDNNTPVNVKIKTIKFLNSLSLKTLVSLTINKHIENLKKSWKDNVYLFDFLCYNGLYMFFLKIFEHNRLLGIIQGAKKLNMYDYYIYRHYKTRYRLTEDFHLSIQSFLYYRKHFTVKVKNLNELNFTIESKIYKNKIDYTDNFYINICLPYLLFFKNIILSLFITTYFLIYFLIYFNINICRQLAIWIIFGLLFFWLFSGFNFFLKRYKFGNFTSAIVRFWKRTNTYFWLVEGFLFLLFFYYYLNSSQEPYYMYDYSGLNQTYLPNLTIIYFNTILLVLVIYYYYYWILNYPNFNNTQNIFHSLVITSFLLYMYFIESYQFYYILTFFFENLWVYNHETNLWVLEVENPRLRVKQQYLLMALIAKYWHFVFIFISWIFFIMKIFEQKRTYYTHSGFNIQNFIILFWLNFLFISQWFKWISRRFLDSIYYWFFTDSNANFIKNYISELFMIIIGWR